MKRRLYVSSPERSTFRSFRATGVSSPSRTARKTSPIPPSPSSFSSRYGPSTSPTPSSPAPVRRLQVIARSVSRLGRMTLKGRLRAEYGRVAVSGESSATPDAVPPADRPFTAGRLLAGYVGVLAFLVAAVVVSLILGHKE